MYCGFPQGFREASKLSMFVFGSRWLFRKKGRTATKWEYNGRRIVVESMFASYPHQLSRLPSILTFPFLWFVHLFDQTYSKRISKPQSTHNNLLSHLWTKTCSELRQNTTRRQELSECRNLVRETGQVSNEGRICREGEDQETYTSGVQNRRSVFVKFFKSQCCHGICRGTRQTSDWDGDGWLRLGKQHSRCEWSCSEMNASCCSTTSPIQLRLRL